MRDAEAHFLPKARGLEPGEEGWFFTGRRDVSKQIVDWLARGETAPPENVYVLTGDGGTGKSAIIGRLVALSDGAYRTAAAAGGWQEGADNAAGTIPPLDAFDAALHLRNLTPEDTAGTLCELLRIPAPSSPGDLASFVASVPVQLPGADRPVTIAVDALDEAEDPLRIAGHLPEAA